MLLIYFLYGVTQRAVLCVELKLYVHITVFALKYHIGEPLKTYLHQLAYNFN